MTRPGKDDVLIVGAGLTGLSAAHHLGADRYLLVEREDRVGGLCRSIRDRGFTFDYTGHLLHMKRPEVRSLVFGLAGESSFSRIERRSGIYSHGAFTDYPFQVNTHGLPPPVVRECVMGFAETLQKPTPPSRSTSSFREWALATFGHGICDHFMLPYNRKLFCTDLDSLTADWVSWSIPKPSWADVVRGAQGTNRKSFGYNATFLYPVAGGIDHLPNAFVPSIRPPALGVSLVAIDPRERRASLSDGRSFRYSKLISTIPLPQLLRRIEGLPTEVAGASKRLRYVSVLNLNLGFDRPCLVPYQWIYFPEPEFPFYRVGVYSNLSAAAVPSGQSAFYVEISHLPTDSIDVEEMTTRSVAALRRIGLVPPDASLCRNRPVRIDGAYVIHDRDRQRLLPAIHETLRRRDILSTGRYGAWEYSAMEDAIWEGRLAAEWTRS